MTKLVNLYYDLYIKYNVEILFDLYFILNEKDNHVNLFIQNH